MTNKQIKQHIKQTDKNLLKQIIISKELLQGLDKLSNVLDNFIDKLQEAKMNEDRHKYLLYSTCIERINKIILKKVNI